VASAVVRRLRTEPAPLAARARRRLVAVVAAAVAALLTAGLLAVPAVRAAVVDLLSLPGVVFDRDRPQPPAPSAAPAGSLGAAYGLTTRVSLTDAPDRVVAPASLGPPDEVYVTGTGGRQTWHLLWAANPDLPALPGSTAGLYLSVFGGAAEAMVQKLIGGVPTEELTVGGRPAIWIGAEHGTVLFGSDGLPDYRTERVAGPTLLVDRGGSTVRIESRLSRADAVALAESLR
jgi:hypothetical protein